MLHASPLNYNHDLSLHMKITALICGLMLSGLLRGQSDTLPPPHFHHLH